MIFDLTEKMRPGDTGKRVGTRIEGSGRRGRLAFGPYEMLAAGDYLVRVNLDHRVDGGSMDRILRGLVRRAGRPEVKIAVVIDEVEVTSVPVECSQGTMDIEIPFRISEGEVRVSPIPTPREGATLLPTPGFARLAGAAWHYALVWSIDAKVNDPGLIEMEVEVFGADIGVMCLNTDGTEPAAEEIIVGSGVAQKIRFRVRSVAAVGSLVIRRTTSSEVPTRVQFSKPKVQVVTEKIVQIRIDVPAARIDLCRVEIATDTTSDRDGRPRPVRITRQDGSIETL
jgi:hypothetical protein